jgi:hypothetical protein
MDSEQPHHRSVLVAATLPPVSDYTIPDQLLPAMNALRFNHPSTRRPALAMGMRMPRRR